MTSLTPMKFLSIVSADTTNTYYFPATPNVATVAYIQQDIDAAVEYLEANYTMASIYTDLQEQAVFKLTLANWRDRQSANTGEGGFVGVSPSDRNVDALVGHLKIFRFG